MTTRSRRIGRSGSIAAGLIVVIGGAALYLYFAQTRSPAVRAGGRTGVPVSVPVASRQDAPICLTGLISSRPPSSSTSQ
jgi:hypothetical protein